MSEQGLSINPSKALFLIWITTEIIGWISIFELVYSNLYYLILAFLCLILSYWSFQKWIQKYKINPIITLRQCYPYVPTFWEIAFKNGQTQKIQLAYYYRSVFLIILIYKPINYTRLSTLVLPRDALSSLDYRKLATLLWPK